MGIRKRLMADAIKENKKLIAFAKLYDCPVSVRKMNLVLDLVRNKPVAQSLEILTHNPKNASDYIRKLLLSAISNYSQKFGTDDIDNLFISSILVGPGRTNKRIKARAQGRAFRIRRRTSHITLTVDKN